MNGAKNKFKPLIFLFFISFITNCKCSTKVDLSKNNDLSIETRKFSYSSTITFGLSANLTRGIFTSPQESAMEEYGLDEGNEKYSFLFTGIGFSFNYNILFSSYFFANRLGFFPYTGDKMKSNKVWLDISGSSANVNYTFDSDEPNQKGVTNE